MTRSTVTPPMPIDIEAVTAKSETSTSTATDLGVAGIRRDLDRRRRAPARTY